MEKGLEVVLCLLVLCARCGYECMFVAVAGWHMFEC